MRKSKQNIEFKIKLDLPEGCSVSDLKRYIKESVQSMNGCYSFDNPLSQIDRKSVKVARIIKSNREYISSETMRDITENE